MAHNKNTACSRLAQTLAALSFDNLDDATVESARQRIFDIVGAAHAGRVPAGVRLLRGPLGDGGNGVYEQIVRLCASARASEVDDIHIGAAVTAGSVIVPVALAVGAACGADDRTVLTAIVAGYEAMVRFGMAAGGPNCLHAGVWTTYLAAPIGASMTAARVLGLDTFSSAHALAIAATRTVGVGGPPGDEPMARWLMVGCSAADGARSAVLAGSGLFGDLTVLETGWPRAIRAEFNVECFLAGLGGNWAIQAVDVKPFCTARQVLAAVEAAQKAHAKLGDGQIERITVRVPEQYRKMIDQPDPTGRLATISSAQFQIGAALARPPLLYDVVRDGLEIDGSMRAAMRAVEVVEAPALTRQYPKHWGAAVEMRSTPAETASCEVLDPRGCAARPLNWEELRQKHAAIQRSESRLETIFESCRGFGAVEGERRVMTLLDRACSVLD